MKVTVTGNCQAFGVAQCLHAILVKADVRVVANNRQSLGDKESQELFANSDVIVTQANLATSLRESYPDKRIVLYPRISFAGYFPDFVQAKTQSRILPSPIGNFHSSIIVWAFANNLSVDQTVGLFRGEVFEALGFHNFWDASFRAMQKEWNLVGLSFKPMIERCFRQHPFMHASNHPKIRVVADVARQVAETLEASLLDVDAESYVPDNLAASYVWPIYPEIAERHGFSGSYQFKLPSKDRDQHAFFEIIDMQAFAERSFRLYSKHCPEAISHKRMNDGRYDCLHDFISRPGATRADSAKPNLPEQKPVATKASGNRGAKSPYHGLPDYQYWRQAIEEISADEVDPVVGPAFQIGRTTAIATAGSCFAQHIARSLAKDGYNYLVTEPAPSSLLPAEAAQLNYGIFSARYGNVYTAKQLDQLFDRAYGRFVPRDSEWQRLDGRYVDPFRPRIDPNGYANASDVVAARTEHLTAVRQVFETADVFIFTLGLTEAWRAKEDGAVFPLAPGVSAAEFDPSRYEFVNFTVEDVVADMTSFIRKLRDVNPQVRIILTVSPVPLVATYEPRHVLVSTTVSKSILRVAADSVTKAFDFVHYFPSYEIITGSFSRGRYFENDVRSVTSAGVEHVMRLFSNHYLEADSNQQGDKNIYDEILGLAGIVCDEEEMRLARGERI